MFGGCVGLRCVGKSGYRAVGALNGMRDGDSLTLSCGAFDADVSFDGVSFTCNRVSDDAFGSANELMSAFCDAVGNHALERDMDEVSGKWVDGVGFNDEDVYCAFQESRYGDWQVVRFTFSGDDGRLLCARWDNQVIGSLYRRGDALLAIRQRLESAGRDAFVGDADEDMIRV